MLLAAVPSLAAEPEAPVGDASWNLVMSPWTHHYRDSPDYKAVWALGLERWAPGIGTLSVGGPAEIVVLDPVREWTVDPAAFASKGKNTPLGGRTLRGQVIATIYAGELVYALDEVTA